MALYPQHWTMPPSCTQPTHITNHIITTLISSLTNFLPTLAPHRTSQGAWDVAQGALSRGACPGTLQAPQRSTQPKTATRVERRLGLQVAFSCLQCRRMEEGHHPSSCTRSTAERVENQTSSLDLTHLSPPFLSAFAPNPPFCGTFFGFSRPSIP